MNSVNFQLLVLRYLQVNSKDTTPRYVLPNLASTEKIIYINFFIPSTLDIPPGIFEIEKVPNSKDLAGVGYLEH